MFITSIFFSENSARAVCHSEAAGSAQKQLVPQNLRQKQGLAHCDVIILRLRTTVSRSFIEKSSLSLFCCSFRPSYTAIKFCWKRFYSQVSSMLWGFSATNIIFFFWVFWHLQLISFKNQRSLFYHFTFFLISVSKFTQHFHSRCYKIRSHF